MNNDQKIQIKRLYEEHQKRKHKSVHGIENQNKKIFILILAKGLITILNRHLRTLSFPIEVKRQVTHFQERSLR